MQYVYVLQSTIDHDLYIGCTTNLKERVKLHNEKKVRSTRKRTPLVLIYYEGFIHPKDAFDREMFLKTGWGRNHLRKILTNHLKR